MTFHKSILTQFLLLQKIGKVKKKYDEHRTSRTYSGFHKRDLELMEKIVTTGSMYCGICNRVIGPIQIGQEIIIQKRGRPYVTSKWYHQKCADKKSITYTESSTYTKQKKEKENKKKELKNQIPNQTAPKHWLGIYNNDNVIRNE